MSLPCRNNFPLRLKHKEFAEETKDDIRKTLKNCILTPSEMKTAVIDTNFGKIVIEFFPEDAPKTVENFVKLASSSFYEGTLFHRVIPGFMIRGGDPNTKNSDRRSWGTGGPGYTIKAEFNSKSHVRGIVSMARAQDPDSAGSQFFIVLKDSKFLDRQYTVFGKVVQGMDVVDKIASLERDSNDAPIQDAKMNKVYINE